MRLSLLMLPLFATICNCQFSYDPDYLVERESFEGDLEEDVDSENSDYYQDYNYRDDIESMLESTANNNNVAQLIDEEVDNLLREDMVTILREYVKGKRMLREAKSMSHFVNKNRKYFINFEINYVKKPSKKFKNESASLLSPLEVRKAIPNTVVIRGLSGHQECFRKYSIFTLTGIPRSQRLRVSKSGFKTAPKKPKTNHKLFGSEFKVECESEWSESEI